MSGSLNGKDGGVAGTWNSGYMDGAAKRSCRGEYSYVGKTFGRIDICE